VGDLVSEERVQRRLAAILAADVVGYSRLMGADEAGTRALFNSHLKDLIEPAIARQQGRIVKTLGDGILVEFLSVVDAVQCAVAIQKGMAERNAGSANDGPMIFRIGINLGDVIIEGDDIHGDGVNIAARLEGLADPGGICISGTVFDQVGRKLDLSFDDLGEQSVKNIAEPVRTYRIRIGTGEDSHPSTAPVEERPLLLPDIPSIAVLPFSNMSADPEQEYFADGMVEEIITGLSRIRWLTVIARNSTFSYKGKSPDVRKIGQELAVRYVLEGSVRKSGDRVRITAQLAESEAGGHLWADRFDGSLADVFDLQDQITSGVVAAIEPSIRKAEIERAKRKRPGNLDAYDLYLRALEQSYNYTPAGRDAGLSLLDEAISIDPNYAQAHGVAAFCLQQRFLWGGRAPADREAALIHAEAVAAARTDDATTLAFAALALSALAADHDAALVMVDRALELNPSSAIAHNVYALINMMLGLPDKSVFHAERSLRLSPLDPLRHIPECALSVAKLAVGQPEAALVHVRRGLDATPVFSPGLITLALCLVRLGRIEEARLTTSRLVEIAPDTRIATLQERYLFSNGLGIDRITEDLRLAGLPE
jgi:TolB-like protein